ncbi:MAG: hypothetical protein ABGX16_26360 [Pirellulales bacterium]
MPEPLEVDTTDHSERDAASLKILGFFFSALGALVLVGTLWSLDNERAVIVNIASGTVLLVIGFGTIVLARRAKKKN